MRGLLRTAGVSRLVVVGSPWRVSLDNPSCRTFTETRVQRELFDYSNGSQIVSNANICAYIAKTLEARTRRGTTLFNNLFMHGLPFSMICIQTPAPGCERERTQEQRS